MTEIIQPPREQFLREDAIRGGMDLLFFANTRALKRADDKLAAIGLGRAHHRVLYFVARRPDLTINGLLDILGVTKQSFARVSKELMRKGLLEQRTGERDRRHRLLRLTREGAALERELFVPLHDNVARAYVNSGPDAVAGFWTVIQHLIGAEGRQRFQEICQDPPAPEPGRALRNGTGKHHQEIARNADR